MHTFSKSPSFLAAGNYPIVISSKVVNGCQNKSFLRKSPPIGSFALHRYSYIQLYKRGKCPTYPRLAMKIGRCNPASPAADWRGMKTDFDFKGRWERFWATGIGLVVFLILWAVIKFSGCELPRR